MTAFSARWFALGFAATLIGSVGIDLASAQGYGRRSPGYGPAQDYVVAESVQGNGRVRGAVRQTSLGPQVQLPGGSWIYCRRSCSETLRVETVDFWEARRGGPGGQEMGLFGLRWSR